MLSDSHANVSNSSRSSTKQYNGIYGAIPGTTSGYLSLIEVPRLLRMECFAAFLTFSKHPPNRTPPGLLVGSIAICYNVLPWCSTSTTVVVPIVALSLQIFVDARGTTILTWINLSRLRKSR
jgi:hypothetical protein